MQFSLFGESFNASAGIVQLMDDLGAAMCGDTQMHMLGGGNPGHIPEVQNRLHEEMQRLLKDQSIFNHMLGNYDGPQGDVRFIEALADNLSAQYGWQVSAKNIAVTNGSQNSFFYLFNLLAGRFADGKKRKILLPITPEYIGYSDLGIDDDIFCAAKPLIERLDNKLFKYRIDFDNLPLDEDLGAICVSRPTNPTGNVLTDNEIERLDILAASKGIPLIIDNAYGMPFPQLLFTDISFTWNPNIIMCMSLSKLGLPGVRSGIVVAHEDVIQAISALNAIVSLAPGSIGPVLVTELLKSGELQSMSREIIRPYYYDKAQHALSFLQKGFEELPVNIHVPEGALFLWLWFEDLPMTSEQLYQHLKSKGVLVISGHHFFPGVDPEWPHRDACLRVTYSQDIQTVEQGLQVLIDEVKALYGKAEGV